MQPLEMLLFGQTDNPDEDALSDSDDESDSEDLGKQIARERHRANKRELRHQYKVVLDLMPNLRNDMKYLDEDDLIILSNYINFHLTNVRGDDGGSLRDRVITYLRDSRIKGFESAPSEVQKFYRGWSNMFTARMLCPQNMLARFDANPEAFCEMIISGPEGDDESILRGGNFPSFLYDQKQADPENELQGLLRSPYLLTCYKSLWTGPSSARLPGGRQNKTAGRPPIAWANNFFKVTPRTLAYTAVQVRYELTSLTIWSSSDIAGFSAYELFNEIVALFADPESDWYLDTLAWWNKQVFANAPDKSAGRAYNNRGGGPQTTAEKLRVQRRKEKKARKAMQSQAHGCAPSHP
ncbi:hypothetical protein C8Q73DRAFT_664162 [Cubamyces lactineus]|nr:hypothetical protein C8Q73DRAFT_664162 [Cubamyces lactineus]